MTTTPSYPVLEAKMSLVIAGLSLPVSTAKDVAKLMTQNAAARNRALTVRVEVTDPPTGLKILPGGDYTTLPRPPAHPDGVVSSVNWSLSVDGVHLESKATLEAISQEATTVARQLGADFFEIRALDVTRQAVEADDSVAAWPAIQAPEAAPDVAADELEEDTDATMLASDLAYGSTPLVSMGAWNRNAQAPTATATFFYQDGAQTPADLPPTPPEPTAAAPVQDDVADTTDATTIQSPEPVADDAEAAGEPEATAAHRPGPRLAGLGRWRTPLVVGVCAVVVLGAAATAVGAVTASHQPSHSTSAPAHPKLPGKAAAPVVAGYAASPALTVTTDSSRLSRNGTQIAYLNSSGELIVKNTDGSPLSAAGKAHRAGAVLTSLHAGHNTPIYPYGPDGFALLTGSGDHTKMVTWTRKAGFTTTKQPTGTIMAMRSGHVWTSTPSSTTSTKTTLLDSSATVYPTPAHSGASLLGFGDNTAIWAALTSKHQPQVRTSNTKGKVLHESNLKAPAKKATVARWLTANTKYVLILWKSKGHYILATHNTGDGKLKAHTTWSVPSGQSLAEVNLDADTASGMHGFGAQLIDMTTGTFPTPQALRGSTVRALRPRAGGVVKVMTNGTTEFYRTEGWKNITATTGDVVDLTPHAVVVSDGNTIHVYPAK